MNKENRLEETYTFRKANFSERHIREDLWEQLCALTTNQHSHALVQHDQGMARCRGTGPGSIS